LCSGKDFNAPVTSPLALGGPLQYSIGFKKKTAVALFAGHFRFKCNLPENNRQADNAR